MWLLAGHFTSVNLISSPVGLLTLLGLYQDWLICSRGGPCDTFLEQKSPFRAWATGPAPRSYLLSFIALDWTLHEKMEQDGQIMTNFFSCLMGVRVLWWPGNFWGAQNIFASFSCFFFFVLVFVWPGEQEASATPVLLSLFWVYFTEGVLVSLSSQFPLTCQEAEGCYLSPQNWSFMGYS